MTNCLVRMGGCLCIPTYSPGISRPSGILRNQLRAVDFELSENYKEECGIMDTPFHVALPFVLLLAGVVALGNFFINRKQGMRPGDNIRETRMWGVGFIIYAALDYLILTL